jgi:hypothetical protein
MNKNKDIKAVAKELCKARKKWYESKGYQSEVIKSDVEIDYVHPKEFKDE